MYCIKCGKRIPEQSKFCPFCATNQLHPDLDDELEASDDQLASTDDKNQRESSRDMPRNKASGKHGRKAVLIAGFAVGLVALVIGIVIASQSSLFNPEVREEQDAFKQLVTSDLEGTASQIGLASDWSSGEEPDVTSVTIDQIENSKRNTDGADMRSVDATVVYEDGTLRTTSKWSLVYTRPNSSEENTDWTMDDILETERTTEPMGPIADEAIVEHGPSLLEMAGKKVHEDSHGKQVFLEDLYKQNVTFSVTSNTTGPDGGEVELAISAQDGIFSYAGTLTATFVWDRSDWAVTSCVADDAAYEMSLDGFIGTWQGEFESTEHNSVMDAGACYGGRANPVRMVVKSVDSNALTATVDLSFLFHDHYSLANDAETSEGDTVITANDVLISINPNTTSFYQIYEGKGYEVYLKNSEDGTIQMKVSTTALWREGAPWMLAWRNDVFTMNRVEPES